MCAFAHEATCAREGPCDETRRRVLWGWGRGWIGFGGGRAAPRGLYEHGGGFVGPPVALTRTTSPRHGPSGPRGPASTGFQQLHHMTTSPPSPPSPPARTPCHARQLHADAGAWITSDSWAYDWRSGYDAPAHDFDAYLWRYPDMVSFVAAGNQGACPAGGAALSGKWRGRRGGSACRAGIDGLPAAPRAPVRHAGYYTEEPGAQGRSGAAGVTRTRPKKEATAPRRQPARPPTDAPPHCHGCHLLHSTAQPRTAAQQPGHRRPSLPPSLPC